MRHLEAPVNGSSREDCGPISCISRVVATEVLCYKLRHNFLPLATHGHLNLAGTARLRVTVDSRNGLGDFWWYPAC